MYCIWQAVVLFRRVQIRCPATLVTGDEAYVIEAGEKVKNKGMVLVHRLDPECLYARIRSNPQGTAARKSTVINYIKEAMSCRNESRYQEIISRLNEESLYNSIEESIRSKVRFYCQAKLFRNFVCLGACSPAKLLDAIQKMGRPQSSILDFALRIHELDQKFAVESARKFAKFGE